MTKPILLLDGGMGQELIRRGHSTQSGLWSAAALLTAPGAVRSLHEDYIAAGADIITTNSYSVTRAKFSNEGMKDRFADSARLAGQLAVEARERSRGNVLIAGSLAPLSGTYRPDLVGLPHELAPAYREQSELLAPYVDLFLCETMSSGLEARCAALAAGETGKPVWVSWTLADDGNRRLRSGETIAQAWSSLVDIPIEALLVNCSSPESLTSAMPALAEIDVNRFGGYANAFTEIPANWRYSGDASLPHSREDLGPEVYAEFASDWINAGATIVGGCCETGPNHIRALHGLIESQA